MGQNKVLIGTIAAAGIVVLLLIGYKMGQRQAPAPGGAPTIQGGQVPPSPGAGTGSGHRRQQMAQSGQDQGRNRRSSDESASGNGGKGGRSRNRSAQGNGAEILGSVQVAVVADGKTSILSGADIQKLKSLKVAAARGGVRDGWALTDVLGLVGVQKARELVFTDSRGKTLPVSWEKVVDKGNRPFLSYGSRGSQLWLVSGREMNPNEDIQAVMRVVQEDKEPLFFPGIVKIEVKS